MRRAIRGRGVAIVLLILLAGCAIPSASRPEAASPTAAAPTGDVGARPAGASLGLASGNPSAGAPTTRPSSEPPAATGEPSARPAVGPPAAVLVAEGLAPVAGTLGSWSFDNSGSDSPWLPGAGLREVRLAVAMGPIVRLATGERIGAWSAQVAAANDTRGERSVGAGGRETAEPPLEQVELEPLQAGRWVLAVRLELANGRGDATWYWLVSAR